MSAGIKEVQAALGDHKKYTFDDVIEKKQVREVIRSVPQRAFFARSLIPNAV